MVILAAIVMVSLRAVVLALMSVVPVAWCLSLEGGRANSLRPLSIPHLTPQDLTQDTFLPPQVDRDPSVAASSLSRYDDNEILRELDDPTSPASYRLQQVLSEAGAGAADGARDLPSAPAEAAPPSLEDYIAIDPLYYYLWQYLNHGDEAGRKVRNSRNTNNSSSSNSNTLDNNSMAKRTWPNAFPRRRTSGLSLSIDASMKVLRQALYLEMARKKQRQHLQRAQHNQKLLNDIGKRDVTRQLQQERPSAEQQRQQQRN